MKTAARAANGGAASLVVSLMALVHCGGVETGAVSEDSPGWYGKCATDADCGDFGGGGCVEGTCLSRPDGSDPCAPSNPSTSEEALAAVTCRFEISGTARLVYLKSSSLGAMGASGRSDSWLTIFHDPPRREELSFAVSPSELLQYDTRPASSWCGPPITPLPSSVVVPDAFERVASRSKYDFVNVFVIQSSDDCDPASPPRYVTLLGSAHEHGLDGSEWWFSYYDDQNVFERLCGPCPSGTAADCTHCAP